MYVLRLWLIGTNVCTQVVTDILLISILLICFTNLLTIKIIDNFTMIFILTHFLSVWVIVVQCQMSYFSAISWWEVIFDEWWCPDCTRLTSLVGYLVLADWNNRPRVDMWPHLDIFSWFQANKSLLLLLHARCLAEKQPIL